MEQTARCQRGWGGKYWIKEDGEISQIIYMHNQWTQTTVVKARCERGGGQEKKIRDIYNGVDIKKHMQYFHILFKCQLSSLPRYRGMMFYYHLKKL